MCCYAHPFLLVALWAQGVLRDAKVKKAEPQ
jgi:hypothetical protein